MSESQIDLKRQPSAPASPPRGDERLYADASGQIRKRDAFGVDAVLGGSVAAATFVEPTTATPEAICNALIAAGLMEAS